MTVTGPEPKQPQEANAAEQVRGDVGGTSGEGRSGLPPPGSARKWRVFWICAAVAALLLFSISVIDRLAGFLKAVVAVLNPILLGAVIAYLCDPLLNLFEYQVFGRMRKGGFRRGVSIFLTILSAFAIVVLTFAMIIPELIKSLTELFGNYEDYVNNLLAFLQGLLNRVASRLQVNIDSSGIEKLTGFIGDMFGSAETTFETLLTRLKKYFSDPSVVGSMWRGVGTLITVFKNLFFGLFVAFYLLASKEKRLAQIRKFRRAVFSPATDERITEVTSLVDRTFSGFLYGKIMDSLVIGFLTFVLLTIFEVSPYNLLIATFVAITNIIPVFGPFIGAIPSFFIVLISNPSKALLFCILIFLIQQLDGNIIGPKILGDNTGISPLGVLVAILVCSALWGIVGMVIGVPVCAVLIELIRRLLDRRLEARGQPTDTRAYYAADDMVPSRRGIWRSRLLRRWRIGREPNGEPPEGGDPA